jgi:hypothetical protein
MKTYEQWSSRAKQQGWAEDQYSQAAYQGYVNNMNQPKPKKQSSPAPTPTPNPLPPLQQDNQFSEVNSQLTALTAQMQAQTDQYAAEAAKAEAMRPGDASKALNSTLLTGTTGIGQQDKKKKQNFLQPIGG